MMWDNSVTISESMCSSHPVDVADGDLDTVVAESVECFTNLVGRSLFNWRTRLANPHDDLRKAVSIAEYCAALWSRLRQPKWTQLTFPLGTALLLSYLLRPQGSEQLVAALPDCTKWKRNRLYLRAYLDVGLATLLKDRKVPDGYMALIAEFEGRLGHPLLGATHRGYLECVQACLQNDADAAVRVLNVSEALYLRRAQDVGFTDFSAEEGASNANPFMIDYGIALIMYCFPNCFPSSLVENCHHSWRW